MFRHNDLMMRFRIAQQHPPAHFSAYAMPQPAMLAAGRNRWIVVLFLVVWAYCVQPSAYAQQSDSSLLLVSVVDEQGNIGSPASQPVLLKRAPYVGIGAGRSTLTPDTDNAIGIDITDDTQTGIQLTLGLDVNNRWSVELHGADLGSVELSDNSSISYRELGLSALFYGGGARERFNRQGWTVFGRTGVGSLFNSASGQVRYEKNEGLHWILGAGVERSTRSGLALRAEGIAFDRDVTYMQLGLLYRFDSAKVWLPTLPGLGSRRAAIAHKRELMSGKVDRIPTEQDADGDGVLRLDDKCPDTPSGIAVGENGCAVFNGVIDGLTFVSGSAELTVEAQRVLDSVANSLQQIPEARARVTAHTDSLGEADANMRLSQQRALSVARYLVNKGIRKARLEARAFGEIRPIDTNATVQGRRNNRRVEIDLIAE